MMPVRTRRMSISPGLMITSLSRVACSTPWRLSCRNALRGWVHMRLPPTSRRSLHLKPGLNGEASKAFFSAKMDEHGSVSEHVVKMPGYVQFLNALECQIPYELAVYRVLQPLPPSYKGFVLNYNMQGMTKTPSELFAMLKSVEVEIKKEHAVFMVNKTTDFKKSSRREKAKRGGPKRDGKSVAAPPKAPKPKPGVECFYCKGEGHWKHNCPKYLKDKKAGKVAKRDEGIFDIHIVDLLLTSTGNTS